jgi:hypothetical protein
MSNDYDPAVLAEILPPELSANGDDPEPEAETPIADGSLLDSLKSQRASVARKHTLDVEVTGWRGLFALRLGSISGQQQARLVERAQRERSPVSANIDTLIAAFQAALGRRGRDQAWEVLADPTDGSPLGLDSRLADALDLGPARSAREVVALLFQGANSPGIAIAAVASDYMDWAREATDEIDEAFLGES